MALDLFLFFFAWEVMLIPMYFLIVLWGHEDRIYAGIKFFLFTQGSGLLMLLAILALAFVHRQTTGTFTFDYFQLLGTQMHPTAETLDHAWLLRRLHRQTTAVPFHTWLPDAHTQAPTAGSVILAGVLLKTGAYGLLRFVVPLFPLAAMRFAPVAMLLGVIGIIYGALLAYGQNDVKRLVAYSSVSHLGFVLLGIFAWNVLALQGVVMQMLAHGVSTGALFIIAGALQERLHTRDMRRLGGLWANMPLLSAVGMFFAIASLGLPGLGNFIGEFLILLGTYQLHPAFAAVAALGVITAAAYSLILVQRTFHGPPRGFGNGTGSASPPYSGHGRAGRSPSSGSAFIPNRYSTSPRPVSPTFKSGYKAITLADGRAAMSQELRAALPFLALSASCGDGDAADRHPAEITA